MRVMQLTSPYVGFSNKNKPTFNGLTKKFKNQIFIDGQKDIEKILQQHPNTNPVVGQLPNFIFKKLPVENRVGAIHEILGAFDDVANSIREFEPDETSTLDEMKNRRPKKVNEILTGVFRKYGILKPWDDDIDVRYIDQGGKGKVFKIEGLRDYQRAKKPKEEEIDDEFVIKVFHQIKGKDWQPFKSHGCYAEINNGIYWRHHEGHDTHRGKFFFASMRSGYIVSKYLDEDARLPKRIVPEYQYGIKCTDEEKDGPINGYNRIKGYNYDYGGMRLVNRLKNGDKVARYHLEQIKARNPKERIAYWLDTFNGRQNQESKIAGLALGIKYMDDKNFFIEKCLKKCEDTPMPKVTRALGYVLKYLPHEDALKYFERLMQTDDEITQVVLLNEIPLLSKRKDPTIELKDDINSTLQEIIPEHVYEYYIIAEKYAMPETIEHLASFVHLLPKEHMKEQYDKLIGINNYALQDRMIWKLSHLPKDLRGYAISRLRETVTDEGLQERLGMRAKE